VLLRRSEDPHASACTFTQPADTPASVKSTSSTTSITDDGSGNLTDARTPSDAPPCTMTLRLNGDGTSATLDPNQTCSSAKGGTIAYTSGSWTMNGTAAYTTSVQWSYRGTTAAGAPLVGTGTGSSTCTKM
jgi:hypothetical protein